MTPDQEVVLRRLVRYACAPEGRRDKAFPALARVHVEWVMAPADADVKRVTDEEKAEIRYDRSLRALARVLTYNEGCFWIWLEIQVSTACVGLHVKLPPPPYHPPALGTRTKDGEPSMEDLAAVIIEHRMLRGVS